MYWGSDPGKARGSHLNSEKRCESNRIATVHGVVFNVLCGEPAGGGLAQGRAIIPPVIGNGTPVVAG